MSEEQNLMAQVAAHSGLPAIPIIPVDLTGKGLSAQCLPASAEIIRGIMNFRDEHAPESSPFHCVFHKTALSDGKVAIHYVLSTHDRQMDKLVAKTFDDDDAIKIVIGNTWKGRWMTPIRWELYDDPELLELNDMGRFDQFSFLEGIDPDKMDWLKSNRLVPRGNWDFDHMLWPHVCHNCGNPVAVNNHIMSIDQAVCGVCGNRPWLSRSIGNRLEEILGHAEDEGLMKQKFVNAQHLHLLSWITKSGATFDQVRLSNERELPFADLSVVKMFDQFSENVLLQLSEADQEQCNFMLSNARRSLMGSTDRESALDKANRGAVLGLIEFLEPKLRF